MWIPQKHVGTHYAELLFLDLVGSACHEVHSGATVPRNINAVFFILGWDWYGFHKSAPGHVMPNLCFCIRRDMRVM
jgi:hypothetical protein